MRNPAGCTLRELPRRLIEDWLPGCRAVGFRFRACRARTGLWHCFGVIARRVASAG